MYDLSKCHAENPDEAKFCAGCGAGVETPDASHSKGRGKKGGKPFFLALLAVLIVGGAFFAWKWPGASSEENVGIAYLSKGELFFQANPESAPQERILLEYYKTDPNYVIAYFKNNYLYYFDDYKDDDLFTADLKRIEVSKLRPNVDLDKITEEIPSVRTYDWDILNDETVTYSKHGKNGESRRSYYFDGKESHDMGDVLLNAFGNRIISREERNNSFLLSFIDPKNLEHRTEIAEEKDIVFQYDDKYVFRQVNEDKSMDLCEIASNQEKTLIAKDVAFCAGSDDQFFYTTKNKPFRHMEEEYYTHKLYLFKNGQSTLIEENAVDIQAQETAILYHTLEQVEAANRLNNGRLSLKKGENHYIVGLNSAKPILIRSFPEDSDYNSLDFFPAESGVYIRVIHPGNKEELFYADIKGQEIEDFKSVESNYVSVFHIVNDTLYAEVREDDKNQLHALTRYHKGEKKTLIENVIETIWINPNTGQILVSDGETYDAKNYVLIDAEGKNIRTFLNVSRLEIGPKNRFYYISNHNLYTFNGKEEKKIASDVDRVWLQSSDDIKLVFSRIGGIQKLWSNIRLEDSEIVGLWTSTYVESDGSKVLFEGMVTMEFFSDGTLVIGPRTEEGTWKKLSEDTYEIQTNKNTTLFTFSDEGRYIEARGIKIYFTNDPENYQFPPGLK